MLQPGVLSYALAAAAFAGLALFAFISQRNNRAGKALVFAAAASVLWATLLAANGSELAVHDWAVLVVEAARYAGWFCFLYMVAPPRWPRLMHWLMAGLFLVGTVFGGLLVGPAPVVTIGCPVAALLGLVLIEQAVRNAPVDLRRDMRLMVIGLGGLLAYDLFLFSQAELLSGIDAASWQLRGVVNALAVPFLIAGTRRLAQFRIELFLSRQATFYTFALVALGVYVLIATAAGLWIQRLGGTWGEFARFAFLAAAMAVAALLVGSVTIRRQTRVFLSKHFYQSRYDYRHEWLRFIRTLSSASASDVPRAAVQSVAQILNSPGGLLYRQPEGSSEFVAVGSWSATGGESPDVHTLAADSPLVDFMRHKRWIIDLRERELQPELYDHADVPQWLAEDAAWRLMSPIFLGDTLLGFFLLREPPPPFRLMYEDRDLLNVAGQHVATLLAQHDADRRVAELSQFEAYNRLTTFVMHDLKNCAAQLKLLVGNATRHRRNPEFVDDAFTTIERTSERMTRLIAQLRREGAEEAARLVDLREALQVALRRCAELHPRPVLEALPDRPCVVLANSERLVSALEHVVRNAQEAAGRLGEVRVVVERRDTRVKVWVRDSGAGMDSVFIRNRLFRPFDTTKGPTGMGIGAYQAREFARSAGGSVEVRSEPGQGTTFGLEFPVVSA